MSTLHMVLIFLSLQKKIWALHINRLWDRVEKAYSSAKEEANKRLSSLKDRLVVAVLNANKQLDKSLRPWKEYAEEGEWNCGLDDFWMSKFIAKLLADKFCHQILGEINNACKGHDACVTDSQRSRDECHIDFCEDLERARNRLTGLNKLLCQSPRIFCKAVVYGSRYVQY